MILSYIYKVISREGYYYNLYTHARTTEGIKKIYESVKGCYILIAGKRHYIDIGKDLKKEMCR